MLTISVKNFGPIAEGSVDLKPLTIFVGPSNTGKSYIATAVYAVMQGFEGPYHWMSKFDPSSVERGLGTLQLKMSSGRLLTARNGGSAAVDALIKWAAQLPEDELGPRQVNFPSTSNELRAELEHSIGTMLGWIAQEVLGKIGLTYGEPSSYVKRGGGDENFLLSINRPEPLLKMDIPIDGYVKRPTDFDSSSVSFRQPYLEPLSNQEILDGDLDRVKRLAQYRFLEILDSSSEPVFSGLPRQSFYLPASRTGLTQAYKVLSSSIVRQCSSYYSSRATLPGSTTDFLSNLISLDPRMLLLESKGALDLATHFIETDVLRGKIDLDDSAGLPFPNIAYETTEGNFTIEHTSSMVSELAPLVLFLKYLVHHGDLIILEEPESHLHPAAQRQLARGIVRLVNAGVKVLITTHSETFVSQINHLLRISYASKRWLKEHNFQPEDCIGHEQVAAYQFGWDEQQGGSVVKPLEIRKDIGISEDEFIGVIDSLYEESLLVQRIRVKQ